VHYLDCGLPCRGAYLTEHEAIRALGRRRPPPTVCMHGTPRQWDDPERRWLEDERQRCRRMLAKAGVPTAERLYYATEPPSLEMHFRVVGDFAWELAREATVPAPEEAPRLSPPAALAGPSGPRC
jgi:hypothetical protein